MLQSVDCTILSFQKHPWTMKHILETAVLLFLLLHCRAFHLPPRHRIVTGITWGTKWCKTFPCILLFRGFHSEGEKINSIATCSGFGTWWKNWLKNMYPVPWWVRREIKCVAITRSFHQTMRGGCCLLFVTGPVSEGALAALSEPFLLIWLSALWKRLSNAPEVKICKGGFGL